jgi:hypothetical protein
VMKAALSAHASVASPAVVSSFSSLALAP